MNTKIITDSVSDLSSSIAGEYDIDVLPINIALDEKYTSVYNLSVPDTVKWITENKKHPKFKGTDADLYISTFEKYVNQGMEIVCITAGSSILSNYDCAHYASTRFPNSNIHIIDSHQMCVSVGFMALEAAEMSRKGENAEMIAFRLKSRAEQFRQYGVADTIDFLQYAGICPKVVSVGSSLLNAKFEFEVQKDMHFAVKVLRTSMRKVIPAYCKNVFKNIESIDPGIIFIMYTLSDEDYYKEVYRYISNLNYFNDIVICGAGHYTNSLVGRNGISIAYQIKTGSS